MTPFALFGIHDSTLNLVVNLVVLVLVILWLALLYWTFADARRRIADPMLVACATASSVFPFIGTVVYMIVRPPEYLDDVRERELEMQSAEARLQTLDSQLCPHCDHAVERDYLRCPHCLRKLKEPCPTCSRPVDPTWQLCPYCETELRAGSARRGASRRPAAVQRESAPERAPRPQSTTERAALTTEPAARPRPARS